MLKFFKNLFGSGQAENNAQGGGFNTPFAPAQKQTDVAEADAPSARQPSPYAAPGHASGQPAYADASGVRIPLQAIIAALPLELKTRVHQTMVSGVFVTLPLGRVVAQLAVGAVRMSFGELRAAAPEAFSTQNDRDNLQVALPLNEILPQVNPAFLPRRQAQRQLEVPDDVRGPFGNDCFGVTFAETKTITGTQVTGSSEPLPEPAPVEPPAPPAPVAPRAIQPPQPAPLSPPPRGIQPPKPPTVPPTFMPKAAPIAPQPPAMKPPSAPMSPRPAPAVPKPAPMAPQATAKSNPPTPPVPFRNPFAPAPPATPSGPPPVRPAFPTARGVGATPQTPAAPNSPSTGSNGNGNGHVPPPGPMPFNPIQRPPQPQQPPIFQRAPQPQQPQQPPEQPIFQRAPQSQQPPVPPEQPIFQRAPQRQQPPQPPEQPIFQRAPQPQQPPAQPIFQRAPQPQAPQLPEEPIFQRAPQPPQPPQQAPQFHQAPPAAPAPQPAAIPAHQPAASSAPEACLDVPLAAVSESWPEVLHGEIQQLHLSGATLSLPLRVVEPSLKQGKIAFSWKVLRSWIRPAVPGSASAHDGMMLELPLKVIAPLFFTRQRQAGGARSKIDLDENIPNLFFGFPQPDSAAEDQPAAPASAVAGQEAPEGLIFSSTAKPSPAQDTNFYVWGETGEAPQVDETEFKRKQPSVGTEFMSRYATPNEIVSRAAAIDGVVGALVALPDGLMVASKLSADLNGDTLAPFLPHIFGKVSQCTKELRMGELNNLNFTVGNVPWKIFRVNSIYFAAFGRAGQALPTAQLAALAAELDRKK